MAPPAEACFATGAALCLLEGPESTEACLGAALPLKVCRVEDNTPASVVAEQWTSAFEWTLHFPLARVWDVTRDFVNISKWLPTYMRKSALVEGTPQQPGCVRSVVGYEDHLPPAYDKLLEIDEQHHKFKYRILTCHLPLLMGHSPTFHFLQVSPTATLLKFSTERPPVTNFDEQTYRNFVYDLYSGFVSDLIKTLSTST